MSTCDGLALVVLLGNTFFLVGRFVHAACPDNGTPVLQMCSAESQTVSGVYLDSRGMASAYLECSCRVVSSSPVDVTVTPSSTLNPTTCKFTDVFFNAGLSNVNYTWNCDNPNGFPTVNERVNNKGSLSFTIKRTDTSNSPDPGYCILLTAQTMVDVICGELLQTAPPITRRPMTTIDTFPLKRRTTVTPPFTTSETTTVTTTVATSTSAVDSTSLITPTSTEQSASPSTSPKDTTTSDVTTSTSDSVSSSSSTATTPTESSSSSSSTTDAATQAASSASSSRDTISPVSVTPRNTFRRDNATIAILPFPPFTGTRATSAPSSAPTSTPASSGGVSSIVTGATDSTGSVSSMATGATDLTGGVSSMATGTSNSGRDTSSSSMNLPGSTTKAGFTTPGTSNVPSSSSSGDSTYSSTSAITNTLSSTLTSQHVSTSNNISSSTLTSLVPGVSTVSPTIHTTNTLSTGNDTSSTSTFKSTSAVTGTTDKSPRASVTGTRELVGLVVGCILGAILLVAVVGVCRYYHSSDKTRDPESDASTLSTSDGSWDRTLFSRSTLLLKSNASTLMYKPSHEIMYPPVNYLPTYKVY
ncbi:uncharacterized protein [Haliotis asinina]|uniref:uncharacterized protein isoform X1 n=1 Tax=Haliotis asinina TaxID=109174 RepID=UPI00353200CB